MARKPFSVTLDPAIKARLAAHAARLAAQAAPLGLPAPGVSVVARQALEAGLDVLDARHPVTAPTKRAK